MKVDQLMTSDVVSVTPDSTVGEVAKILCEKNISGLPVVNEKGEVVGVVSEGDLLPKLKKVPFTDIKLPALFGEWFEDENSDALFESAKSNKVADVMNSNPLVVDIDTPVSEAVEKLLSGKVKRLPVVKDEKLVGILTRTDFLRGLARQ